MARKRRTQEPAYTGDSKHTDDETQANSKKPKRNPKSPPPQKTTTRRTSARNPTKSSEPSTSLKSPPSAPPETKPSPSPLPPTNTPPSQTNRDAAGRQQTYWLFKAEPLPRYENGKNVSFSISDLAACTEPEPWTGVRNFQARNNMMAMRAGDLGFFYHSNAKPSGIVGVVRVVEEAKVDETAFDPADPYYDAKSVREKPKWWCVGVEFVREFKEVVSLATIKEFAGKGGDLENLQLVKNARLSVCKITGEEWEFLLTLAEGEKDKQEEEE